MARKAGLYLGVGILAAVGILLMFAVFGPIPVVGPQHPQHLSGGPASVEPGNYTLSGPHSHANLTVFLIHGPDRGGAGGYLTLDEALASGKAVVHETQNVNQLTVENRSPDEELFIQAGDIVKGGQQDRTLEYDLIIPVSSGQVPLASFCVEHGRWQQRGEENSTYFSASSYSLSTRELKIAARHRKDQGEVWSKVAQAQQNLTENVGKEVRSSASTSSLQLTLENSAVKEAIAPYLGTLGDLIDGQDDVIGYVFAINGRINSAEVYGSHALFKKLWPKLIRASATEAVAELGGARPGAVLSSEAVQKFLVDAESGRTVEKGAADRVHQITQESPTTLLFESRDRRQPERWIHRTYLRK